jgi:hypothetical protein
MEILKRLHRGGAPGGSYGVAIANADDDISDCRNHVNNVNWQRVEHADKYR